MQPLLDTQFQLRPDDVGYRRFSFEVSQGVTRLDIYLDYQRPEQQGRIYPILEGPEGFRGFSMYREGRDSLALHMYVSPTEASPGALPGPITTGEWRITLDPLAFSSETCVRLRVHASQNGEHKSEVSFTSVDKHTANSAAGWYRGELHAHTSHSDGEDTTEALVQAASDQKLDFLSLTDHFTISGYPKLTELQRHHPHLLLMRGVELTSHKGHANLHGLQHYIDLLVDTPERSINAVIDDIHAQNGLFCVNHPFSNRLGWQRHDTDWAKVDLMEVYHHLEYHNNILQLGLWDQLLNAGFAIVGIAGTDSHNAYKGRHKLGQCFTYVYADELSEKGILAALKRGCAYITLGPEISFEGSSETKKAAMFESLPLGERCTFTARAFSVDRPATLYILKNGLYFDHRPIYPGDSEIVFHDRPDTPAYYRLEWHVDRHVAGDSTRRARSWDTLLAISNPIFVGAEMTAGRWKA